MPATEACRCSGFEMIDSKKDPKWMYRWGGEFWKFSIVQIDRVGVEGESHGTFSVSGVDAFLDSINNRDV